MQFTLGMPFLGVLGQFYRNRKGLNEQMKRTVEVKYGITLHTKQMIKVNELTTGGDTSNLAKHLSLAHPDLYR